MTRPALLLTAALALSSCVGATPPGDGLPTGILSIEASSGPIEVAVSIAETPEARQVGLMGVTDLPEDAGMVFLEQEPVQQSFWMKDTLIPLSVAFWDEAGEILAILDMEPCTEDPCELYDPGVTWIGAVEVNQGFFADQGIEVGDSVSLQRED